MKAALISLGSESSIMTAEAMKKFFEQVDMIQLKDLEVSLGRDAGIFYRGQRLGYYDCVYLKGSFRYANLLRSIAAMLEGSVGYMPIPSHSFTTVHNKLLTHLVLEQHRIPMPRTYISSTPEATKDLLKRVSYPIVMKFPEGTQGKGVMFADSVSSASSLLDALGVLNQPFIVQEYIETGGTDIRALVVGGKVVAAMRRRAEKQEKRANIHAGGKGEAILLSPDICKLAVDTAKVLGTDICGIDILESPLGPQVIEANLSPGLQGLNSVSTLDIPLEIAKFLYYKTEEIVSAVKKKSAAYMMKEIDSGINGSSGQNNSIQHIITPLQFRGERVLLPEIVSKIAHFKENKDYSVKISREKLEIKESEI